jgi:hypothetical protein
VISRYAPTPAQAWLMDARQALTARKRRSLRVTDFGSFGPGRRPSRERMIGAMAATMENERKSSVVRPGLGDGAVMTPAGLHRIVVPVDGSPFAERALPVATWVARALGTPIHLVEVVTRPAGTEPAIHYLDRLARRYTIPSWDVAPGDDPAGAIIAATEADPPSR